MACAEVVVCVDKGQTRMQMSAKTHLMCQRAIAGAHDESTAD